MRPTVEKTRPEQLPISNIPVLTGKVGLLALQAARRKRSILGALEVMHRQVGDVFRIPLPGFSSVVLVGPEANRFVLVEARDRLRWRAEDDPVTQLLLEGLLVVDKEPPVELRGPMNPAMHRQMVAGYLEAMQRRTDQVIAGCGEESTQDMLAEMRRIALLIVMDALFGVDFWDELERAWPIILRLLKFISPGAWQVWRAIPQPGYERARHEMHTYLQSCIQTRRRQPARSKNLLDPLLQAPNMSDARIRDPMLTVLIAGHDTSTALLSWTLHLSSTHPCELVKVQEELDNVLGAAPPGLEQLPRLRYLEQVIEESLRLYPPIRPGSRIAIPDLEFRGYRIRAGHRFSIIFLVIPAMALAITVRRMLTRTHLISIGVLVAAALIYTTPWENYLVAQGVWYYDPRLVLGTTSGWVPLEEYLFFTLQPVLMGLWLVRLAGEAPFWRKSAPSNVRCRRVAAAAVATLWLGAAGLLWSGWNPGTYLGLELIWGLPPIALQVVYGADILWAHRKRVGLTLLSGLAYLGAADSLAIRAGAWTIAPGQSGDWLIGGILPFEEPVFCALTNILITRLLQ